MSHVRGSFVLYYVAGTLEKVLTNYRCPHSRGRGSNCNYYGSEEEFTFETLSLTCCLFMP